MNYQEYLDLCSVDPNLELVRVEDARFLDGSWRGKPTAKQKRDGWFHPRTHKAANAKSAAEEKYYRWVDENSLPSPENSLPSPVKSKEMRPYRSKEMQPYRSKEMQPYRSKEMRPVRPLPDHESLIDILARVRRKRK